MLNLCYEFSQSNDIIFDVITFKCMVFKSSLFKLYCPAMCLIRYIIKYVEIIKYLEYMFTNDKQDDVEMLRQLRLIKQNNTHVLFL